MKKQMVRRISADESNSVDVEAVDGKCPYCWDTGIARVAEHDAKKGQLVKMRQEPCPKCGKGVLTRVLALGLLSGSLAEIGNEIEALIKWLAEATKTNTVDLRYNNGRWCVMMAHQGNFMSAVLGTVQDDPVVSLTTAKERWENRSEENPF